MADVAFDTDAPVYEDQLAQLPPQPVPGQPAPNYGGRPLPSAPAAPAPTPAPAAPAPQAPPYSGQAIELGSPPPTGPTTPPLTGPKPDLRVYTDQDDENDYKTAGLQEQDMYARNLLEHDTFQPMRSPAAKNFQEQPEWQTLENMREQLDKMTPKERAKYTSIYNSEANKFKARIAAENKAEDVRYRTERQQQLRAAHLHPQEAERRVKNAQVVEGFVTPYIQSEQAKAKTGTFQERQQADFNFKTSPLATLVKYDKDGVVVDATRLRDVITNIVNLNPGISVEQARTYANAFGSPQGFDERGKPLPGFNGVRGKGATAYQVIGRDAIGNWILVDAYKNKVIVDQMTKNALDQARVMGYQAGKDWMAEDAKNRAKAQEPGLGERILRSVIPPQGFGR